ncbi:PHB depolymerase family esterase [Oceaniovalibus sp. ACAM 378]|nr:PHB depolymerase family esterase [Oceaniovalibus sp. ACAM 378]
MHDPFKRLRARSTRQIRRSTLSAITDVWGAMISPAKPARRKSVKAVKPVTKAPAKARKVTAKGTVRTAAKPRIPATSRAKSTIPRGALFANGSHASEFGTRSYKLYVPAVAKTATDPLPLIVMLHGCGQTPEDFAHGTGMNTLAEEFGFLVLYPAQARKVQLNRCWNWFKRADQVRGAGEPALIASLTRHVIAEQNIDPAKVYAAGLSAGGSAALILATGYPDIFAAVGVHSGLAVGSAHDAASAARAMQGGDPGQRHDARMPTIIFHGEADKVVNPRNGRFVAMRALEPFDSLEQTEKTGRTSDGRQFTRKIYRVGKGRSYAEHWVVHGLGHAWSGGNAAGSFTDANGPDASREMVRFLLRHRTTKKRRSEPMI